MSSDLPTPDETRDELASLRAAADQVAASMPEFAVAVAAYFNSLVEAGLTRAEALELCIGWQRAVIHMPKQADS